jgi:1-acyl-sn-glycerol-3-phosphate acyltransferase
MIDAMPEEPGGTRYPRSAGGAVVRAVGRILLRLAGWRVEGSLPERPRFVVCVGPHTSNWDFVVGYAAKMATGVRASWLGKHTLFRGLMGPLLRWMGGIPVDRRAAHGVVEQAAEWFARRRSLVLGIAPEGTRRPVDRWKMGFYHIARLAAVPVVPVALDWGSRRIRIGDPIDVGRDESAELERLIAYFRRVRGRHPERAFPRPESDGSRNGADAAES